MRLYLRSKVWCSCMRSCSCFGMGLNGIEDLCDGWGSEVTTWPMTRRAKTKDKRGMMKIPPLLARTLSIILGGCKGLPWSVHHHLHCHLWHPTPCDMIFFGFFFCSERFYEPRTCRHILRVSSEIQMHTGSFFSQVKFWDPSKRQRRSRRTFAFAQVPRVDSNIVDSPRFTRTWGKVFPLSMCPEKAYTGTTSNPKAIFHHTNLSLSVEPRFSKTGECFQALIFLKMGDRPLIFETAFQRQKHGVRKWLISFGLLKWI